MDARTTALSALIATRRQNAWSDGVLKDYILRDRLDSRVQQLFLFVRYIDHGGQCVAVRRRVADLSPSR